MVRIQLQWQEIDQGHADTPHDAHLRVESLPNIRHAGLAGTTALIVGTISTLSTGSRTGTVLTVRLVEPKDSSTGRNRRDRVV